jgi:hypothetical protein
MSVWGACHPKLVRYAGTKPTFAWLEFSAKLWRASFACDHERRMVDQNSASWNRLAHWFGLIELLKKAA